MGRSRPARHLEQHHDNAARAAAEAGDKTVLSEDEREALASRVQQRLDQDKPRYGRLGRALQRVLVRARHAQQPHRAHRRSGGRAHSAIDAGRAEALGRPGRPPQGRHPADFWVDRSSYDRCISRGMPGSMLPGFYNHNYQIVQTKDYVAILVEMVHDVRIIPLDRRPHLNANIRQWLGDSRGHFEGNTLVIETTNFNDKVLERGAAWGFGGNIKMVERFTRDRRGSRRLSVHDRRPEDFYAAVDGQHADGRDQGTDLRLRLPRRQPRAARHPRRRPRRRAQGRGQEEQLTTSGRAERAPPAARPRRALPSDSSRASRWPAPRSPLRSPSGFPRIIRLPPSSTRRNR